MQLYYASKNIQSVVPFLLFLCISTGLVAQGKAGEDKMICQGGSTTIGTNLTVCSGCCIKWTPATGLSDPKSATPNVQNLSASTEYSMAIVNTNGDIVENDKVIVYLCKLDLNLYKPKFVDGMEHQVPKGQEETLGAQTFVNLDSDDNDNTFDNADNTVAGGDDEFIRIEFLFDFVNLGTLPPPTEPVEITVSNVLGTDATAINLWKSEDKSEGSFALGEKLTLLKTTSGTKYTKSLWIEGKIGHTVQRQSQIYATFEDGTGSSTTCESIKASITILGVKEIKWIGQTNGYTGGDGLNNSDDLDTHSSQNGYPSHVRVFPESKFINGAPSDEVFDKVNILISLSVSPIEAIPVYIRLFDADDPSSDNKIDFNDNIGSVGGLYPGVPDLYNMYYDFNDDNRGTVNGNKYGWLPENIPSLVIQDINDGIYKAIFTNKDTYLNNFQTSTFLGDNYVLAFYCDLDFINRLRNQDVVDKQNIVFNCNTSSLPTINATLKSSVLTVWRTLHLEMDRMENPIWANNKIINGYFTNFGGSNSITTAGSISGIFGNNSAEPLRDGSLTTGNGRFENGGLYIGSPASQMVCPSGAAISCIASNDYDLIRFKYPKNLTLGNSLLCTLRFAGVPDGTFAVLNIEKTTILNDFKVTIKNTGPIVLSQYDHGSIIFENGPEVNSCISIVDNTHFTIKNLGGNSRLKIPITIIDDDNIPFSIANPNQQSTLLSSISITQTKNIYSEAYIDVVIDGGGNLANNGSNIPFISNLNTSAPPSNDFDIFSEGQGITIVDDHRGFDDKKNSYWGSYVFLAWQSVTKKDGDPQSEDDSRLGTSPSPFLGIRNCFVSQGSLYTIIFCETNKDFMVSTDLTFAHELGHQFGLSHGYDGMGEIFGICGKCVKDDCEYYMGIMCASPPNLPNELLIPAHLNLIRCRIGSPGSSSY
jgi:hypothetical protein